MESIQEMDFFSSDIGVVNFHLIKGTHWVCYVNENCCGSYGCSFAQKLSKLNSRRNGPCLLSENKIQGLTIEKDSYCAGYCLYILYLTKVVGTVLKSAVLNLYCKRNA